MSRQLDSLLKGLSIFKDGMETFSQNKAISEATSQMEQIAMNQEIDAEDRVEQLDTLSNTLRLKLMGSGASPAEASMSGSAIGLTPLQRINAQISTTNSTKTKEADPFKVADLRFKQQKFLRDNVNDFSSQTKDLQAGIISGQKAAQAIDMGVENASAAGSVKTMLAKSLQPGNLTDREQAVFAGNPQLLNVGKRLYRNLVQGKGFTPQDQSDLREYNNAMLSAQVEEFNKQKSNFLSSNEDSMLEVGLTPDDLNKKLDRFKFKTPTTSATASQKLEAALKDPRFKSKWPQIKAKLKELEGR